MKKISLIVLIVFINVGYSQTSKTEMKEYILCDYCNGTRVIKAEKWVACNNCKSYKEEISDAIQESLVLAIVETTTGLNSKPSPIKWCNVCSNKKGRNEIIVNECKSCAGRGKIRNSNFPTKQNEIKKASKSVAKDKNLWYKLKMKERERKDRKDNRPFKPGSELDRRQKKGNQIKNRGEFNIQ